MKSGIYQIKNIINNKIYIGSSKDIAARFRRHKSHLNCNKHCNQHLQRAWNKHGQENFVFEIISLCKISNLIEQEQKYLDNCNPEYNICRLAKSVEGRKTSLQTKQKQRAAALGRKVKEATKQKISKTVSRKNLLKNKQRRISQNHPTSKYKGVAYAFCYRNKKQYKRKKPWTASAQYLGKRYHLGYFQTEKEAAIAYDNYMKKLNVDVKLNFGE